ncbi:hypothetical protein CC77DRAFT_581229 [Alternaria alternata]|uniref:Uncharacterized protein n=1 Tax=Alternaria alternata TaxID=5599 RepID=A0A177D359_ALTAL|nr:hypothetical protein CC77DRAFT_581229 [Alternaria alternata]OAG13926.1 hypothetical protein CC77DRAFT_581229 [Alternaria alternata]
MSATNHSGPTIHTALVLSIQPSSTSPHPPPPTHAYARIAQPLPPKVMAAFPIVLISNAAKKKRRSPAYFQMQVQAIGSGTRTASPATAANIIITFGVERECAAANVTHLQSAASHVTEM